MISSIALLKIISMVPDPKIFWIAPTVADTASINPNDTKTLFTNRVTTSFMDGKVTLVNGAQNFSTPPSWLLIFRVVPFIKVTLLFKVIITLIISLSYYL